MVRAWAWTSPEMDQRGDERTALFKQLLAHFGAQAIPVGFGNLREVGCIAGPLLAFITENDMALNWAFCIPEGFVISNRAQHH